MNIEMRINQRKEEGEEVEINLKTALKECYRCHMKDGTFVSRIAVEDNRRMARTVESIKTVILRVAPFCGNNSVKPIFRI